MLQQSIKNGKQFLDLFYNPEIDAHELTQKTIVSLYVLRIDGGRFDYESMNRELGNAAITYVFSRTKFEGIKEDKLHEHIKQVQESFRDSKVNDGEGGELFLYCFLETHLNAPKILSKMELKTATNDYVKGADGIHLLDLGDGNFHLIFGESKMISDSTEKGSSFRKAIADAFKSIKKVETEGIGGELNLVDSNLMKESYSEATVEFLKKIIKPSARDTTITKMNAFGIFVGFEIDINDWDLQNMTDPDFEKKIKEEVKKAVEEKYDYIKEQITNYDLTGYHFYIYAVPFIKKGDTCIDSTRKKIIEYIQ
jgi:hypothetical protein